MTRAPDCDPSVLIDLERRIGRERLAEILDLYLEQAPERIDRVREARHRGDSKAVAEALHAIRASAAMLGAAGLSDACERMERPAGAAGTGHADQHLADLEHQFSETQAFLRERREALRS